MNLSKNSTVILALSLFATIPASAGLIANGDFEANGAGSYINARNGIPPFGTPAYDPHQLDRHGHSRPRRRHRRC